MCAPDFAEVPAASTVEAVDATGGARPRLSRETRRLLTAAALALAALWLLAGIRFPDRAATTNPVAPVLNQLASRSGFPDLADEVELTQRRIQPRLAHIPSAGAADGALSRAFPAWPMADGEAVAILPPPETPANRGAVVARDAVTGLSLVRTSASQDVDRPIWKPDALRRPRYVFAMTPSQHQSAMLPVYVSSFEAEQSAAWTGAVWTTPADIGLQAGAMVFTAAGEWIGIVADERTRLVVVPAETVLIGVGELRHRTAPPATLGLRVQSLSPMIAASTGVRSGVIVTWVDSPGLSPDAIAVGDVIETLNGDAVPTVFAWTARIGRLVPGAQVRLRRHRAGAAMDVSVRASAAETPHSDLGLTLALSGDQSRVVRVVPGSAADQAGIRPGDLLSAVGASTALTPWELTRRFELLPPMGTMLLSVARGDDHHIVVLTR